ncbi:MAG: PDZ domain-containing protein [Woeseiaceae bacterium]|nr:PDZ domain-containing protein [Woeseiaceae bacterium]
MNARKLLLSVAAGLLFAVPGFAQDDAAQRQQAADAARDARQMEQRVMRLRASQEQAERELEQAAAMRAVEREKIEEREEIRIQMREAEEKLAEAAQRIAELSQRNLPHIQSNVRAIFTGNDRPRLGVTVASGDKAGPVEGVEIDAVTPGSAADEAGLRAGDVLTLVNDESLSADSSEAATKKLLDFMSGVEAGDKLKVEYLRKGKVGTVEVEPKTMELRTFDFLGPGGGVEVFGDPDVEVHVAPDMGQGFSYNFGFPWVGKAWGDMEMVELSDGLGRYFGTSDGLLIISVSDSNDMQLEDGDVLQSIDGREPTSVGHAMRILGSYEAGEEVTLKIMRDKKRKTLKVTMPDARSSSLLPPASPLAPASLLPPVAPPPAAPAAAVVPPAVLEETVAPRSTDTRT